MCYVGFLFSNGRPHIGLKDISGILKIPVRTLKGWLFDLPIDPKDILRRGEDCFLSETSATCLLEYIGRQYPRIVCLSDFTNWLENSFAWLNTHREDITPDTGNETSEKSHLEKHGEENDVLEEVKELMCRLIERLPTDKETDV